MKQLIKITGFAFVVTSIAFTSDLNWKNITREEFEKVKSLLENFYSKNTTLSMTVTHASYKNYTTEIPHEQVAGYFRMNKNNYHSFLMGVEAIQNEKFKISVDSSQKLILVANPDNLGKEGGIKEMMKFNYELSRSQITAYKIAEVKGGKIHRVEFTQKLPYTAYEMDISEEGLLRKLVIYYRNEYPSDIEDEQSPKTKPRLSITFSEVSKVPVFSKDEFDHNKYITISDKKILPSTQFSGYKVADLRVSEKTN